MIETEKKILLTQQEYDFLLDAVYPGLHPVRQTNYYYDTESFSLNAYRITCRIRRKGDRLCATVKYHSGDRTAEESVENSFSIEVVPPVLVYQEKDLMLYGSMETERRLSTDSGLRICIDRNTYLGMTDYELEIEYEEGHEQAAARALRRIAGAMTRERLIPDPESFILRIPVSKSERFFERLKAQRSHADQTDEKN